MMTRDDVERSVREIFALVLKREVAPGTDVVRAAEPAWDSLKHMDLVFTIEERYEIQIKQEEIPALHSLNCIVDRVIDYHEAQHSS
jgi:acyl carrier protein